jgi:protein-disulfide isomerase
MFPYADVGSMGKMKTRNSMGFRLAVLAGVAVVAVLVAVMLAGGGSSGTTGGTGKGDNSALRGVPQSGISLGSPKAPVTMVEFADLQCPFCAEYHRSVFPTILNRYVKTGKVRLELRLLRFIGPDSDRLARAALAAAGQNRMWQFVGLAYDRQGQENSGYASDSFINGLAAAAGARNLDAGAAAEQKVRANEQLARTLGIQSTPSFLIGRTGGKLSPFQPSDLTPSAFTPRIDRELAR